LPSKKVTGEDLAMYVRMYIIDLIDKIDVAVKEFRAQRLVIDSLSLIEMFIEDKYLCRVAMIELLDSLREFGVTSIVTGTISEASEELSGGGIVEYLVDGIIKLDFVPVAEEFKRTLNIRKMRRTDHSIFIHPFEVTKDGLKIIEIKPD
jgi:KaiC/GvpD/RAD55 family RecA-like ATPase